MNRVCFPRTGHSDEPLKAYIVSAMAPQYTESHLHSAQGNLTRFIYLSVFSGTPAT